MIKGHKPIRITIIEDDKKQSDLLEALLTRMNYEVNSVYNGVDAIEILTHWIPDIILLDLYLPDMTGIQVAEEITKYKNLRYIPIIMMSVDYEENTVINALANGIDEFVSKPIRLAELTLRIATMIELKRKERELSVLNIVLNDLNIKLEKEKNILAKYFSYDFVEQILNEKISPQLGGENITGTMLFFDIRNSVHIAEKMEPHQFSKFLSDTLTQVMHIIFDNHGSVNKLLGDGLLATFGPPIPNKNDTFNCCNCALKIRDFLIEFNQKYPDFISSPLKAGVGISTGKVFAGNIGSDRRMEYTVLGDAVNLASRLESLTKLTKQCFVDILIDGPSYHNVKNFFNFKKVKIDKIRGKSTPVDIYFLKDQKETTPVIKN